MRMHGRDMVGVAKRTRCKQAFVDHAQFHPSGRKMPVPLAQLVDEHDPSFAVCEECLLAWDVAESGLSPTLATEGIEAYRAIVIVTGALHVPPDAGRTLWRVSEALREVDVCG